jgi:polyisoprenoid-binding protein YceI
MSVLESAREQLLSHGLWAIDPAHSTVEFRVRHMVIQTVTGRFREFDGVIVAGSEPVVSGAIRVSSLDTAHDERDAHLRSPDFFDVERFPEMLFETGGMRFDGDERHVELAGVLTIKGISRPITLRGELGGTIVDGDGRERLALALSGRLDRSDYGLVWNRAIETGGVLVGDTVDLVLDVAAVRVA